jgi:hypothetical protein
MSIYSRSSGGAIFAGFLFGLIAFIALAARAPAQSHEAPAAEQVADSPQTDMRWGGALEKSFQYYRQGPNGNLLSPATGWNHYGFPVASYRWGWFGASRYYPRTMWHEGFYGDKCRWAYRCGY